VTNPPRYGEGDRAQHGGGVPAILTTAIKTVKTARRLRKGMSLPEVLLWQALRKRPAGFRFRRQFPLAPFVLDFACLESRLAIEVDGAAH
jgi:very-short-patch-repair endonuclease